MTRYLALLRAVNVGGRTLPMAELRALCADELGWEDVETYIQSGNVLFDAKGEADALEAALERAVKGRFGFEAPAMVRTAAQWRETLAANPFEKESAADPSRVFLGAAKGEIAPGAAEKIATRGAAGERVAAAGGGLWFHYPEGAGRSKLTPALIDKAAGTPVTARNWRTSVKLWEMLA